MEQSDQTQRELVPLTSASLVPQTQPAQFSTQEYEPALRAMIEYVCRLEELSAETAGRPEYIINQPFDTGIYIAKENLPQRALFDLTSLFNEALAKKTLPRIGRRLLLPQTIASMIHAISCCFGWYNIGMALAGILFERPSGFLEPLTDAEWQEPDCYG